MPIVKTFANIWLWYLSFAVFLISHFIDLWWHMTQLLRHPGDPQQAFCRGDEVLLWWLQGIWLILILESWPLNLDPWILNLESWSLNLDPWISILESWSLNLESWSLIRCFYEAFKEFDYNNDGHINTKELSKWVHFKLNIN